MDNVFTTLWGLIAFAGFVTALLIPNTTDYLSRFRESVEEADREVAARWSAAVRITPLAVLAGVTVIVAGALATAGWGTRILTRMDFWLLAVSVVAQAGFAFTVRYLVAVVPSAFPRISPGAGADGPSTWSRGGGRKTAVRFDNDTSNDLILEWISFDGSLAQPYRIPAADHITRATYVRHFWRVSTLGGEQVAIFEAPGEPAVAAVTESMIPLRPASPENRVT